MVSLKYANFFTQNVVFFTILSDYPSVSTTIIWSFFYHFMNRKLTIKLFPHLESSPPSTGLLPCCSGDWLLNITSRLDVKEFWKLYIEPDSSSSWCMEAEDVICWWWSRLLRLDRESTKLELDTAAVLMYTVVVDGLLEIGLSRVSIPDIPALDCIWIIIK